MIVRFANRILAETFFFVVAGIVISVSSTAADSFDKNIDSAGAVINRATAHSVTASPFENTSVTNAVWAVPLSKLSMTRDRPIFSPSRRPPLIPARPTVVKPAEPTEPDRPPLTLVGTIASEDSGIAIFVEQTTKNIVRLHTNDSHQGWILHSVKGREVTLQKGIKTSILALPPPGGSQEATRARVSLETTSRPFRR